MGYVSLRKFFKNTFEPYSYIPEEHQNEIIQKQLNGIGKYLIKSDTLTNNFAAEDIEIYQDKIMCLWISETEGALCPHCGAPSLSDPTKATRFSARYLQDFPLNGKTLFHRLQQLRMRRST
jgi:hypothetical protein